MRQRYGLEHILDESMRGVDKCEKPCYYEFASGRVAKRLVLRIKVLRPQSLFLCCQGEYFVYLCYIDESGAADIPGNTSHYVLAGLSIPVWRWRDCDKDLRTIKTNYHLGGAEIHTAWILRSYLEQSKINGFESMSLADRRYEVGKLRKANLLRLQKSSVSKKIYRQTQKNYRKTESYIHLSSAERKAFINNVATCVGEWGFARLFAECIDKIHFDPVRAGLSADEQALEQVVSRFEQYLQGISSQQQDICYGLLIHDNNPTFEKKHTNLMKRFLKRGTFWTTVKNIIETPLYVNSELTSMVQIADLCAYALRRYLENGEAELFDLVFPRADRRHDVTVGVRHFTDPTCTCSICTVHRQS